MLAYPVAADGVAAEQAGHNLRGISSTTSSLAFPTDGPSLDAIAAAASEGPPSAATATEVHAELPPAATTTVPLHSSDGTHHAYLYVGSPPQRQTLIVDTGSRLVAFPCHPCDNCGKHASTHYYDPDRSTTDVIPGCDECRFGGMSKCENGSCQFVQRYTEGSTLTAYEVTDVMWLGTDDVLESLENHMRLAVPFVFGCQTSEKGLFVNQYADGIMGMAMHQTSLITALHEAGAIPRDAFALCLDGSGGMFSLGGTGLRYDSRSSSGRSISRGNSTSSESDRSSQTTKVAGRHLEPMRFTPLTKSHGWYAVGVEAVHVGDVLITSSPSVLQSFNDDKGTIIDSGTTDSYLPKAASVPFKKAWEQTTGRVYTNKLERYTYEGFLKLPLVTFTIAGDVQWSIRPESYMEAAKVKRKAGGVATKEIIPFNISIPWQGLKSFTNRMYLDEPRGCVLGGNAMVDHDILFDIEAKRVGIARADCTYGGSDYVAA